MKHSVDGAELFAKLSKPNLSLSWLISS